jgi:FkbM family methyltransferase
VSYKRALIRLLDRPLGRFALGKIATRVVQRSGGDSIEIAYIEGLWTRRIGGHYIPDGPAFQYSYADFKSWKKEVDRYLDDAREYWLRYYLPQKGDVIIDVGAGHGEDTLTFSRCVGETGRVLAIEAHPASFAILKNFCRLNQLSNVTPLHVAVMDKPGTVQITESPSSWMEHSVRWNNGAGGMEVRAATLDELCREQGVEEVGFLKMNIEGAERYALPGMEKMITHVRQTCVACHDFRAEKGDGEEFRTRALVEQFLAFHGFKIHSRREHPQEYVRDHVFGRRTL